MITGAQIKAAGSFSVGRATGSAREQVSALPCSPRLRTDFARRQTNSVLEFKTHSKPPASFSRTATSPA